jgi:hypothetical protein
MNSQNAADKLTGIITVRCEKPPGLPEGFPVLTLDWQLPTPATYAPCFSLMAACAAARRAMGTRNGEQET